MKIEQIHKKTNQDWQKISDNQLGNQAQLVLALGGREAIGHTSVFQELKAKYPNAAIVLGSTSGEIAGTEVHDNSVVATAIYFDKTKIKTSQTQLSAGESSTEAGQKLASELNTPDLKHVFLLSDGLLVNGTDLVKGIESVLPSSVSVTGGLAGDGALFQTTLVGCNETPTTGKLVAIGFYGNDIKIGYGSYGGWTPFGAERQVTKSVANILYELDGKPALELYKTYLGDKASELPASALLFPLSLQNENAASGQLVRTILSVDEAKQSLTFAGDIPEGSTVRLMKSNIEHLVEGAETASENSKKILDQDAQLAILVSCVGRKLVMGQRVEDETEAVQEVLGKQATIAGFYSYGELAPSSKGNICLLHNQTMTITLLSEV